MFKPKKNRSETHGGEDVPILATGPWAHLFVGVHEQSYFSHAIEFAAGWSNRTDLPFDNSGLENTQPTFYNDEDAKTYIQRLENEIDEKNKEIKRVTSMLVNVASKRNQTFETLFTLIVFIFILN